MIGARYGTPLAVGFGEGEMFLASDSYALAPLTKKICFLEDGDRVEVSRETMRIYTADNDNVERPYTCNRTIRRHNRQGGVPALYVERNL